MNQKDIKKNLPRPAIYLKDHKVYGFKLGNQYLLGMPHPGEDMSLWSDLQALGVDFILCLTDDKALYDPSPLKLLDSAALSDKSGSLGASDLEKEENLYRRLVSETVGKMKKGASVVSHCQGGTGRTGTIMAAVLIELGYPLDQVLDSFDEINILRRRGDHGWPESSWQKELILNYKKQ